MIDDTVTITAGGQSVSGWQSVQITRSVETVPSTFALLATSTSPDGTLLLSEFAAGAECQIAVGGDLVLTGYVDQVIRSMAPGQHSLQMVGRSKCADLVDCSAQMDTYQVMFTDVVQLAEKVTKAFNVSVVTSGEINNQMIPVFNVVLSETPYDIVERAARYSAVLVYDTPKGELILANVGTTRAASGLTEGGSMEVGQFTASMDERYSIVTAVNLSTDIFNILPGEPGFEQPSLASVTVATAPDPGVPRYRQLIILAEQGDFQYEVTKQRAQWEVNRRFGRANVIRATVDSWRDLAGALWDVNTILPVSMPSFDLPSNVNWVLAEVTFRLDESGTHADLVLMPASALQPEPIVLNPSPVAAAERIG